MTTTAPAVSAASPAPPVAPVRALVRGLSVLNAFDEEHQAMRAAEVAARAGLNRAATARVLRTLHQLGYVRIRGDKFLLTHKVLELGHGYISGVPLAVSARRRAEELTAAFSEPCTAGVLSGAEVICIAGTRAPGLIRSGLSVGARIPAHASSMGKVMLADLSDEELRRVVGDRLSQLTGNTIGRLDTLLAEIHTVRSRGYATNDSELQPGHRTMSVPVRGPDGRVVAAIGVNMLRSGPEALEAATAEYLPPLQAAARRIEEDRARLSHD
ncbi:IclR family transcriptional regulator C-terminal domain-containing protein [Arthrobacter crystallopoietes]|uniref:IclR family transcriptional regulator n=1 Tax=Crystallibacter crystallopoietes TaxID=37928 RepID=UPI003D1F9078